METPPTVYVKARRPVGVDFVELTEDDLDRMRLGTYGPWQGVDVIGYPGLAKLFGYYRRGGRTPAEQTVRALASSDPGFPSPRFVVEFGGRRHLLFDRAVMVRYGKQVNLLRPNGRPTKTKTKTSRN